MGSGSNLLLTIASEFGFLEFHPVSPVVQVLQVTQTESSTMDPFLCIVAFGVVLFQPLAWLGSSKESAALV